MIPSRKLRGFLAASFIGVAGCSVTTPDPSAPAPANNNQVTAPQSYIERVLDLAREMHVDEEKANNIELLTTGAINGALKQLDPHSRYMTPEEVRAMKERVSGEFAGIGATLSMENNKLSIVSVNDGAPADLAGVKANDHITHIDGTPTADMGVEDAIKLLRGKAQTSLALTISRNGQSQDITVIRDIIRVPAVTGKMIGNDIGYIQISTFHYERVDRELEDAVKKLDDHNNVRGYVLDLRDNPGGYLRMANAISDAFMDSNDVIMTVKGRDASKVETYYARPGDITNGKPLIVLMNEGSASASEIVAGALQDTGRAVILGTQSYGKGSVQNFLPLRDGSALKVTIARYYTAGGRSIQNHGITPDIAYIRNHLDEVSRIRPESERENSLTNLDAAGTDKTETKAHCTAVTPIPSAARVGRDLQAPNGKADFALACAVEKLRDKPVLTVTTPVATPSAGPKP